MDIDRETSAGAGMEMKGGNARWKDKGRKEISWHFLTWKTGIWTAIWGQKNSTRMVELRWCSESAKALQDLKAELFEVYSTSCIPWRCKATLMTASTTNLNHALASLADSNWRKAISVLSSAISRSMQVNTASFNIGIHASQAASAWVEAFALLRCLASLSSRLSVVTYNTAISACRYESKVSKWQLSVHFLGHLQEADLKCTQFTLSAATVACSRCKWEALTLFDTISTSDMKPNSVSYGAVLDACEQPGNILKVSLSGCSKMWGWWSTLWSIFPGIDIAKPCILIHRLAI